MITSTDIDTEHATDFTFVGYDGLAVRLLDEVVAGQGSLLAAKDAATGRYLRVNAAMAAFLGQDTDVIVGRTDADLIDGALAAQWRASEAAALVQADPLTTEHRFDWRGQRREFYEKPTSERKRKKAAAVKRHFKRVRSMQLPKKMY